MSRPLRAWSGSRSPGKFGQRAGDAVVDTRLDDLAAELPRRRGH